MAIAGSTRHKDVPRISVKELHLSDEPGDRRVKPRQRRLRRQQSAAAHLLEWILINLPKQPGE
jgi:hypothetical protein